MNTIKIQPGLLVGLRTTVKGGIHYAKTDLDAPTPSVEDMSIKRWETTRTIDDVAEYETAQKVRAEAGATIRRVCIRSPFGLLCPSSRREQLDDAIESAQREVDKFNARAQHSRVDVYTIRGEIADSDQEAVEAIAGQLDDLLERMTQGVKTLDVETVRKAANEARQLGRMLSTESERQIDDAVQAAREAARKIVKKLDVEGEEAMRELVQVQCDRIEKARFRSLDLPDSTDSGDAPDSANSELTTTKE